ncbi:aprataxin and PNK-like factor [Diorhabda sublineata]|uniref:aprataxin and PNK-like factor n=1 Tax=Diorhabda sublineata TaxID=1163346 RepID=UPI0024E185CA|nr:aprataxin and PNK-like factor [Diorhabda sublineata]
MRQLHIYSLDDENEENIIATFVEGEHPIGREKLNCKDKRISRNHALITVTESDITIKSTHVNPLFYKPYGGNSLKIVKTNETVIIHDGDQFGLLADTFWFKVRYPEARSGVKRHHNGVQVDTILNISCDDVNHSEFEGEVDSKLCEKEIDSNKRAEFGTEQQNQTHLEEKLCVKDNENLLEDQTNEIDTTNEDSDKNTNESKDFADFLGKSEEKGLPEPNKPHKNCHSEENHTNENDNTTDCVNEKDDEELKNPNNNDASNKNDTATKKQRQKCWYGAKCYRKNTDHKQQYSHAGDSDYDENDIPNCPFGSACYRTNGLHRQHYKHDNPPAQKPPPNTNDLDSSEDGTTARKKRKTTTKVTKYTESPEDDYDLEDPFINNNSSDDFELSDSGDSDSDWRDSQEVEEESQERKRLLKEAKKFIHQKK